jgi:predicted phosphodiesterase
MTVCFLAPTATTRAVRVMLTAAGAKPARRILPASASVIPDTEMTIWKLRLADLQPGLRYQYQVFYRLGDYVVASPAYHFRTLDPAAKTLRAIAFNDTHNNDQVMAALMARVKSEDFDFTVLLGDILEGARKDGSDVFSSWTRYVELLDGANKPIIYVRGNHDTRGAFAKRLALLFDLPNLDPSQAWGEEQWQYKLQAGPVSFVALDSGEDDDDSTPAASYKNPNLWQQVRQRQADWMKLAVSAKTPADPPWRVLLTHMPLYNSPWCSVRSRNLWTPLLREWQPDLALSGHDHQWRAAQPLAQGDPWPTLVGGGPAMQGGEEATMMVLSADDKALRVRLIGAKDGRQITEFVAEKPH